MLLSFDNLLVHIERIETDTAVEYKTIAYKE